VLAGRRRRPVLVVGGLLECAGAALERFAVVQAGRDSARDPEATVSPQRARCNASAVG
jgi:hypothetical protein